MHFITRNITRLLLCVTFIFLSHGANIYAGGDLPPIPSGSAFLDQVDPNIYPSLSSPDKAPLLRWDFSGAVVYPYNFSQTMIMKSKTDDMFGNGKGRVGSQYMEGYGILSLKSERNNVARLVIEGLTVRTQIKNPASNEPKVMNQQAPPIIIQGIKEDGSMNLENSSQDLLLKTLFPLPPSPLKIGESVSVPAKMPFNAMGSLLYVTGDSIIELLDYVQISGKTCAKLKTDIDLSTLKIPEEMEGHYNCHLKGQSIFYFNLEDRHFISGRVALLMSIRVEAPIPQMDFPQDHNKISIPETITMAMDSDNFLDLIYLTAEAQRAQREKTS